VGGERKAGRDWEGRRDLERGRDRGGVAIMVTAPVKSKRRDGRERQGRIEMRNKRRKEKRRWYRNSKGQRKEKEKRRLEGGREWGRKRKGGMVGDEV
jgi:hypothetical protein